MMKAKRDGIFITVFLFIIYSFIFLLQNDVTVVISDVKVLGWFAIIQLFYTFYSWYKAKGTIFDAYCVFIVVLYCLSLAQPILETLNLASNFRRLWNGFGISPYCYYCAT